MLIEFTRRELCFMDDSLTLLRENVDSYEFKDKMIQRVLAPTASTAASIFLITKIGSALLESFENEQKGKSAVATMQLEEDELLILREIAHTGAIYDEERVGLNLKVKVHAGIRSIAIEEVVGELPVVSVEEAAFDRSRLEAFQYLEDDDQ